ncbi:MAG: YunC family protein [Bdellovibrionales bacterium]|nr:YunC family protein [Bdellovibrionales bacterium]
MKKIIFVLILALSLPVFAKMTKEKMNWKGFEKGHIELAYPLLTIRGSKGFLGCGYFNVDACDKTNEACAIVSGVKTHEDMLDAKIKAVSSLAKELGIEVGMTGKQALLHLK